MPPKRDGKPHPLREKALKDDDADEPYPPQNRYKLQAFQLPGQRPDEVLQHALTRVLANLADFKPERKSSLRSLVQPASSARKKLKKIADESRRVRFNDLTAKEWQAVREMTSELGFPLSESGVWDLALQKLTSDQFAYARDGEGYQSTLGSWNAAEHIPQMLSFEVAGEPRHKSICGGMSKLIAQMRVELAARHNVRIIYAARVVAIERGERPGVRLHVAFKPEPGTPEHTSQIEASKAILAVPVAALNTLRFDTALETSQELQEAMVEGKTLFDALRFVRRIPAVKAVAYFDKPWFYEELPKELRDILQSPETERTTGARLRMKGDLFAGAKVLTDVAVRQLYFHGPGGESYRGGPDGPIRAAVVAYCDAAEVEYWTSFTGRMSERASAAAADPDLLDALRVRWKIKFTIDGPCSRLAACESISAWRTGRRHRPLRSVGLRFWPR